jgi:hypothetical protein
VTRSGNGIPRTSVRRLQYHTAARDRILDRAHDEALAQFSGARVAQRDDFRKIVTGVDMQQRKREASGPEGFLREAQQHQRILAAGEEQGRVRALACDFAQDVDRLRFQPQEMMRIGRRLRVDRFGGAHDRFVECCVGHAVVNSGCPALRTKATRRRCSPHSLCSGSSHHQRPARRSWPGSTARVHGAQPMLR